MRNRYNYTLIDLISSNEIEEISYITNQRLLAKVKNKFGYLMFLFDYDIDKCNYYLTNLFSKII